MYTVLARKWRPQVFEDLVGQQTVTKTLQNAILSGRIAHAFLFSGPRGVGKTTCARILAKALNCNSSSGPTVQPCNECPSCLDIAASRSMDVLEIDGASNRGIDEVRELRESAKYPPMRDRFRIFIIDEVHMLTTEAFNALLKILEEPPPHVFFIFATTEFRKVPATIVSRCQPFDFRKIPDRVLVQRLAQIIREEGIEVGEKSLEMIAIASEGGLRDALGTLDQIIAFSGDKISDRDVETVLGLVDTEALIELAEAVGKGDSGAMLTLMEKISSYGIDYKVFYNELLGFYRDLFLIRFGQTPEGTTPSPRIQQLAASYDEVHLLRICHQLVSIQNLIKLSGNLRFLFEITLVKLSQIRKIVPVEDLAEGLKKNLSLNPGISGISLPLKTPAQVAVPPAAVEPLAVSGETAVKTLTDDLMANVISQIETQNPRLAAALENSKLLQSDGKIRFYVPQAFFGMMKLDAKDQLELQNILRERFGTQVEVEIHKGEPPSEQAAVKVSTPETLVVNDPMVQEFVKIFKGKIGKIDFNKERYL